MICKCCKRKLKNDDGSGMGRVCRRKAESGDSGTSAKKVRVEFLFNRRCSRRAYLVFTNPRQKVVVTENDNERWATCQCCGEDEYCEHIALVAEIDRAKFPDILTNKFVEKI